MRIRKEEYCRMIEQSLIGLGVPQREAQGENGKWTATIKGATVWVDIFDFSNNPEVYYFQVMSPLFKHPETRIQELQTDLLEFSHNMYGCGVSKKDNWYFTFSLREAEDLSQSEIDKTIDRIVHYSNDIYSKFKFKYPAEIA